MRSVYDTDHHCRTCQRPLLLDHLQNQGTPTPQSDEPMRLPPLQLRTLLLSLLTQLAACTDIIANQLQEITTWTP